MEIPAQAPEALEQAPEQATDEWEQPGAGPDGPPAGRSSSTTIGGRSRRTRLARRLVAGLLIVLLAFVAWFVVSLFQPFHGQGNGRVVVLIPPGSSVGRISSILARGKVISSGFFFQLRVALDGKRSDLHSGRFTLRADMSYAAVIAALTAPPPPVKIVTITIPEGLNRMQIAQLAASKGLRGSYLNASRRSAVLDPARYGAPAGTPNLEGFLFPATYELKAGGPARGLAEEQLEAFKENVGPAIIRSAHRLHETTYQLLTVASMVEREALVPHDRRLIAAVIYNRLRAHMPLGIDATIYYAVELKRHIPTYEHPLTESDLHLDSPYNTRIHRGLPPTPISNPGMESIVAAAHPADVPYLYYVEAPDGCGEQRFSTTYAEFERNVEAYDQALARNHGHLPACRRRP